MNLTAAAFSALTGTLAAARSAAELPGRVVRVVDDVEVLMTRVGVVVARIETLTGAAADTVERTQALIARSAVSVAAVEALTARAGASVDATAALTAKAAGAVGAAEQMTEAAQRMLDAYLPALTKGAPLLRRFVDEISPREVEAAIKLVDELPGLVEHLTDDILPILETLDQVGPDINELLKVTYDVRRALLGIPGFGFLRKRGAERLEEIAEEEEADGERPRKEHGADGAEAEDADADFGIEHQPPPRQLSS